MSKNKTVFTIIASLLILSVFFAAFKPLYKMTTKPDSGNIIDAENIAIKPGIKNNGKNTTSQEYIRNQITKLIGDEMQKWCSDAGIVYPAQCVLFRTFKAEKEFEIWAGNSKTQLKLIKTIRICSFDDEPGPKLTEGDGKTPEGFYTGDMAYGSRLWFMWMNLTSDGIDSPGEVSTGSSFKICLDYPNKTDFARTKKYGNISSPGSEICVHGNCVSAGCISFKNRAFLPVFFFSLHHNTALNGKIQFHIFPFRFTETAMLKYAETYTKIDKKHLTDFWNNLKEGYEKFNKFNAPLSYSFKGEKYVFSQ